LSGSISTGLDLTCGMAMSPLKNKGLIMSHSLIGLSGSLRAGSFNTMLIKEAARVFDPAEFTLGDIRFPLYDGDLEQESGVPAEVAALHAQIVAADAVIISTPEYNKNLSGALKNALDWLSRIKPQPFDGKPVAILSASAGRAGGERAQYSLRHCMTPFNPRIMQGPEVFIAAAHAAFDDQGQLKDEMAVELLTKQMGALKAMI